MFIKIPSLSLKFFFISFSVNINSFLNAVKESEVNACSTFLPSEKVNNMMIIKHCLLLTQLQLMLWLVQATVHRPDLTPAETVQSSVKKKSFLAFNVRFTKVAGKFGRRA